MEFKMSFTRVITSVLISLLLLFSAPAQTMNFFGIDYHGTAVGNVLNLIDSLIDKDQEKADKYYAELQKVDAELAGMLSMKDFMVPCSRCRGTGILPMTGNPCTVCTDGLVFDANALRFLRNRFSMALDDTPSAEEAWKKAKAAFDERCGRLFESEVISGTVIRREKNGLLIARQSGGEKVFVTQMDTMFLRQGASINGRVWTNGTYTYTNDTGKRVDVPQYTATLWAE